MLKVGLAQISPIWLDKTKTLEKVERWIISASEKGCDLVVFGEALVPGYPFWIELTDGATFNSPMQKKIFSRYLEESVDIEKGDLSSICEICKSRSIATYLGCIEVPLDRGGHSCYCSLVFISNEGVVKSVHRKLMPTYEERLVWSIGDGNGLEVHEMRGSQFRVGGLNCWENWIPLARSSLYALGENVHVAVWPGSDRNTRDITKFIALESRSYVVSVSGLLGKNDVIEKFSHIPFHEEIVSKLEKSGKDNMFLANGGSCVCGPDGEWIVNPKDNVGRESLVVCDLEAGKVREERQNFDPSGHYSRPSVFSLAVNRKRQKLVTFQ